MDKRIKKIAKHYGLISQVDKLSEESAEMIAAALQMCTKQNDVNNEELLKQYISELADVDIVLEQVKFLLTPNMRSYFDDVREEKIIRTLERIGAKQ